MRDFRVRVECVASILGPGLPTYARRASLTYVKVDQHETVKETHHRTKKTKKAALSQWQEARDPKKHHVANGRQDAQPPLSYMSVPASAQAPHTHPLCSSSDTATGTCRQ